MDGNGNIALAYSISGKSIYPSIRATGRRASDPLGYMSFMEESIIDGTGAQTGDNRWGDYSCLTLDPANDKTFWYTNEYYSTSSKMGWKTRIASFTINDLPVSNQKYLTVGSSFMLKNSPNPVLNSTVISWTLIKPAQVKLKIYDIFGKEINIILNERQFAGNHQVTYNTEGLSAGLYFYQISVDGKIETKKMVVTR